MRGGGILSEVTERLEVEVEDQNFRFQSKERPTHDEALTLTGAKRVGDHVILERKRPHATLVFEESGTILVHGLARQRSRNSLSERPSSNSASQRRG